MGHLVSLDDLSDCQVHIKMALDYIQTPRKTKRVVNDQSDDDSMDSPFEKVNAFVKNDPLGGPSSEVRLDALEGYLARSSVETREISRITGSLIKDVQVSQSYHSSLFKEVIGTIGLKSSQFPQIFDGPTLWATVESLGQYALSYDAKIASSVEGIVTRKVAGLSSDLEASLEQVFVKSDDWNEFLIKIGKYIDIERSDKLVYHDTLRNITRRVAAVEDETRSMGHVPVQLSTPLPYGVVPIRAGPKRG